MQKTNKTYCYGRSFRNHTTTTLHRTQRSFANASWKVDQTRWQTTKSSELILFMAIPRRDKTSGKSLMTHFGTLLYFPCHTRRIESTRPERCIYSALKIIQASSFPFYETGYIEKQILNSWSKLLDYVSSNNALEKEKFHLLFWIKNEHLP